MGEAREKGRRRRGRIMSTSQVVALYRAYFRAARKFPDANIRDFLKRRGREEFRQYAGETDKAKLEEIVAQGKNSIQMIERTSLVYGLYAPKHGSVLPN